MYYINKQNNWELNLLEEIGKNENWKVAKKKFLSLTWPTMTFDENSFVFADGPSVCIKLGEPLELDKIEEGHDVYFTCQVDANPDPSSIQWLYNVSRTS